MKALVVLKTLATAVSVAVLLGGTVGVNATTSAPMSLALPSVGSLGADSDYTVFMREGVPDALRLQALSKLWRSHPVIAAGDDLTDYGDDYRVMTESEDRLAAMIVN